MHLLTEKRVEKIKEIVEEFLKIGFFHVLNNLRDGEHMQHF